MVAACTPAAAHAHGIDQTVERDLAIAAKTLIRASDRVPPGRYPSSTDARGRWRTTGSEKWTSGFFSGSLWLMDELTGDRRWRGRAMRAKRGLAAQRHNTATHDVGFMLLVPYARAYRLTRQPRYRRTLLAGARSLASRFSPVVGATRSWGSAGDPRFTVIVDNLMNNELLLWGARHGGPRAWREMAVRHGLTALRNQVRPDGSTFHVVDYDPDTGAVRRQRTRQGAGDRSTWARGQAWAIHGFTTLERYTRDPRFLTAARRVAGHWLRRMPRGGVPPWDFDAGILPGAPRDSSAAAVAASGLLELARQEPDRARARRYRRVAVATIEALSRPRYLPRAGSDALLLHGTADGARGIFDQGLVYGDYYFLEALARLRR